MNSLQGHLFVVELNSLQGDLFVTELSTELFVFDTR